MTVKEQDAVTRSQWPPLPYKGLDYFTAADAPLFGQREAEIADVAALISGIDTRALLLHGGTGTGKSSFLRAGLCPRLQSKREGRRFFFLAEPPSGGRPRDPLMIRATGDPVARIYEALRNAAEPGSTVLSDKVRQALGSLLAAPVPHDRLAAIPAILAALEEISNPPQRDTFVLLIDQAEEVLTLPAPTDIDNARRAFVEFIEKVCFRAWDLRLIIALRTEYYGRFCSHFLIRPTNKLTPPSEFGAGLMDYLLRPLNRQDIAAAIRQPTSDERHAGWKPETAREKYGFCYKERLPEMIADDLVRQAGEGSSLPAMQIVCKQLYERVVLDGDPKVIKVIEQDDYVRYGRAEGAIDTFMVRALREAAKAAKLPPLSDADIDTWVLVLGNVVGRAEGGTVQTLIASEQDLVAEAGKRGIAEGAARAMLREMSNPSRRLLRIVGGQDGTQAYSLGHDSIGPSVLRRGTEAAARIETEKRYKLRFSLAAAGVVLLLLVSLGQYSASVFVDQQKAASLIQSATLDASSEVRLKLLQLSAALRIREKFPGSLFFSAKEARTALQDTLLRSPVFGGTFDAAAWDAEATRIVRLEGSKLIVHYLATGKDGTPSVLPSDERRVPGTISIGLRSSDAAPVTVFSSAFGVIFAGAEGATLSQADFKLPTALAGEQNQFVYRADIFKSQLRIVFMHFNGSVIDRMKLLNVFGSPSAGFTSEDHEVDWRPIRYGAARQPTLAEDCGIYAYIRRPDPPPNKDGGPIVPPTASEFTLAYGGFEQSVASRIQLQGQPAQNAAVAVARGCEWIAVRDDGTRNLHLVPIGRNPPSNRQTVQIDLDEENGIVAMPYGQQTQPMFAVAPLSSGRRLRVGWSTMRGLAFADIAPTDSRVSSLANGNQMLTGVEPGYGLGRLSLSPDGRSALLVRQPTWGTQVQTRVFDLDFDARRKRLSELTTSTALIAEACKIAKIQTNSNQLNKGELVTWLGDENAAQPCKGDE
jgi:hypothetical protein